MTLQQLKYILGVADSGSLNKAAEKLYISQPSLTSSIHDAERELGFKVFDRSSRGVTVTDRGKEFVCDARIVYGKFEDLLRKYRQDEKKTFSVSSLYYSFARKAFVEVVKQFSDDGWDFSFHEITAENVIEEVAQGNSDLGLIYLSDSNKKQIRFLLESKKLEFHHLTECSAFVYLHKNHPLAQKESISLEELPQFQFITFDTDDLKSFFSEETIETYSLKNPIMVSDRATELNLIKNLNGYTFLSGVSRDDANEEFITIPLKNPDGTVNHTFELGYITRPENRNPITLVYIDLIRRILNIAGLPC